jgi:hypothetical protein
VGIDIDRGDVLGTDMARRSDPNRGDAGGAKVLFREEFVARWFARAQGNGESIRCGHVKD